MDKNSKTKDSIIEAAIYLFYMKGYSATSNSEILPVVPEAIPKYFLSFSA